jgi:TRAP-type C4-dicarboxylate transport system permease small subunit
MNDAIDATRRTRVDEQHALFPIDSAFEALGKLVGVATYVITAIVAGDVVSRFFGLGARWPLEVYPYVMLWAGLLGGAYTTWRDGNVRMDLLVEEGWLGPFRRIQPYFASLVSLAYLAFMTWAGTLMVLNLVASGRVTYELRTPLFIHAIALPLGLALAGVAAVLRMLRGHPSDSGH